MISASLAEFVAGWVGGMICVVTGYPFDTIKVRQQHLSISLITAAKDIYKHEGTLGFFKGMASPLMLYGPSNSIFFGCTKMVMKLLNDGKDGSLSDDALENQRHLLLHFISGCIGGFVQTAVMCPVELVKIVLQTSREGKSFNVHNTSTVHHAGTISAFKTVVQLNGFKGLFKGFGPMLIRDVPTSGIYFVTYQKLLPSIDKNDVEWHHKLWAGGCAGIASISTVLPADVIKTRLQADDMLYPNYKGITDCARKLYHKEGLKVFWKGLPVITLRAFPAHAMLFIGYEMTMELLVGN